MLRSVKSLPRHNYRLQEHKCKPHGTSQGAIDTSSSYFRHQPRRLYICRSLVENLVGRCGCVSLVTQLKIWYRCLYRRLCWWLFEWHFNDNNHRSVRSHHIYDRSSFTFVTKITDQCSHIMFNYVVRVTLYWQPSPGVAVILDAWT